MNAGGRFELAMEEMILARRALRTFAELPDAFGSPFNCEHYLDLRDEYDRARRALMKQHVATGTVTLFDGRGFPERPWPQLDVITDGAGAN